MISLLEKNFILAIINKSTNSIGLVENNINSSSVLNYIIGGLVILVLVLISSLIFKRKS